MINYHSELQALVDACESFAVPIRGQRIPWQTALDRARAALAQPEPERAINWPAYFVRQAAVQEQELKAALAQLEPEGPTEQEWDALVESAWDKYMTVGYQGECFIYQGDFDTALGFVRERLARWGNNTSRSNFDD